MRRGLGLVGSALGHGTSRRIVAQSRARADLPTGPVRGEAGLFASPLAGSIGGPLAHLSGTAELLLETPLAPLQQSYVRAIALWADEIRIGIDRVLGRADTGTASENVHLADLVAAVLKVLADPARLQGVTFIACIEPDVPAALPADRMGLRKLLVQLCAEALKRTGEGEVSLRILRVAGGLRIVVMDGAANVGATPPDRRSASVERLAQSLGGEVDILDAEEGGSVSVTLPFDPRDFAESPAERPCGEPQAPVGAEALLEHLSRELLARG